MLAATLAVVTCFALPERPWSVAVSPVVGGALLRDANSSSGRYRLRLEGGAVVDAGFRLHEHVRLTALALGVIHQNNSGGGLGGGQSGLFGFLGGLEGVLPLGLLRLTAGLAAGIGFEHFQVGRVCLGRCEWLIDQYREALVLAPSLGVMASSEEWPSLSLGATARPVVVVTTEIAAHLQFALRLEYRF